MNKNRRGISAGTILALVLTVIVVGSTASILSRVSSGNKVNIDTGKVLAALRVDALPEISMNDIPIQADKGGEEPQTTPPPKATARPAATSTPEPKRASVSMTIGGSLLIQNGVRKSCYYSATNAWDLT